MPSAFAQMHLSPGDAQRCRGLPWPPWLATQAQPEVAAQLQDYAAQIDMVTLLLAARVIAATLCAAQHCAWILRHGDSGCGPVRAHEAALLACAQALYRQNSGAAPRMYMHDTHLWGVGA